MAVATAPQAAATTRQPKGWLATLVVGALMILIVGGGFVAQASVADAPPIGVRVANGVYVYPLTGWEFAGRSEGGGTVLLTNGSGSLAITPIDQADRDQLLLPRRDELADLREKWLATGTVTASEPEPVSVGRYSGRRFAYTGTFEDVPIPVEGEVTGIEEGTKIILFDGWAGVGQYATVKDDVEAMIDSAAIQ